MQIVTRKAAKELGLKHYYTDQPCRHGHVAQRLVSTRVCVECDRISSLRWSKEPHAKAARLERERERRRSAREAGEKYYFTGRPCKRGHIDKRHVSSHACMTCQREKMRAVFSSLTKDKREARREYNKKRWQDAETRAKAIAYRSQESELEKQRIRNKAWKTANRSSCTDRQNKRHAQLRTVFVEDVSLDFLFERDNGTCQLCGHELSMTTKWPHPRTPTRDHVIPLSKGGTHERSNLQLACAECNVRKGAKVAS